jgi:hypothetical protein
VATPRDGVVLRTRHQPGADTPKTQSVINPKAIDAQPITIDHSGDPALQRSGVVLQQQGEPFEFGRECAVMKGIDLLDKALAGLGNPAACGRGLYMLAPSPNLLPTTTT